jgi:hypothetical protein
VAPHMDLMTYIWAIWSYTEASWPIHGLYGTFRVSHCTDMGLRAPTWVLWLLQRPHGSFRVLMAPMLPVLWLPYGLMAHVRGLVALQGSYMTYGHIWCHMASTWTL